MTLPPSQPSAKQPWCRRCGREHDPNVECPSVRDSYDAHGPEAWSLGRESYAHLGYMMSVGPHSLRHHLIHAHGFERTTVERTLWVEHVEQHAMRHEVAVRSAALRDLHAPLSANPEPTCCDDGPPGHTRQEHHDASPCYDQACPMEHPNASRSVARRLERQITRDPQ